MPKAIKKLKRDVESVLGSGSYKNGLQALTAADRAHITVSDTRGLGGSADIDGSLKASHPNAHRWDYVVAHTKSDSIELYWVEVHPARTGSNLTEVLMKLAWLKKWLSDKQLDTYRLRHFVWISSGKTAFNQRSPQHKQLASQGCTLVGHLTM